jgi:hypothetical protein
VRPTLGLPIPRCIVLDAHDFSWVKVPLAHGLRLSVRAPRCEVHDGCIDAWPVRAVRLGRQVHACNHAPAFHLLEHALNALARDVRVHKVDVDRGEPVTVLAFHAALSAAQSAAPAAHRDVVYEIVVIHIHRAARVGGREGGHREESPLRRNDGKTNTSRNDNESKEKKKK